MQGLSQVEAFGRSLYEVGGNEEVVVIDLDVSDSTKTAYFGEAYPDRFIQVGIGEQDGVGVAAGLALSGKIPVVAGFAFFLAGRAWEQIANTVARQGLNVKVVASHSGLSPFADGGSHQMLWDIALMRVMPGVRVEVPCDAASVSPLLSQAINHFGPVYLRLARGSLPIVYSESPLLELGKAYIVREGGDVTLAGAGVALSFAVEAAGILKREGVDAQVLDLHSVKPLDCDSLIESVRRTGAIVTVEDHSVLGGVGGAVAEAVSKGYPVPLRRVGVCDVFGESSRSLQSLYEKNGLTACSVVKATHQIMKKR